MTVSRHHCVLDIDPPMVRVRDLGSLNGTFVNDRNIGQRQSDAAPAELSLAGPEAVELHAGDRLVIGTSEFRIDIQTTAVEPEAGDGAGTVMAGAPVIPSCAASG
jgi:pSer/pThr/pTyr-binding forkhead associated (FHA) protein